jgi:hypothetical protein
MISSGRSVSGGWPPVLGEIPCLTGNPDALPSLAEKTLTAVWPLSIVATRRR